MVDVVISQPTTSTSAPSTAPAAASERSDATAISAEEAKAQIRRNQSSKEWRDKFWAGDMATRHENDRLLLIASAGKPDPGALTVAQQAARQLEELRTDKKWCERFLDGDIACKEEFDRLTDLAGRTDSESEKALAASGEPAKPEDYRLDNIHDAETGRLVTLESLDSETKTLVSKTLFPAAHALGLSQAEVTMSADCITHPMDEEKCETTLRRIWKGDLEKGLEDFRAAVADPRLSQFKLRELFETYPDTLGNNAALISSIVGAYRRRGMADKVARKRPVS
jgi:hypothetical protein